MKVPVWIVWVLLNLASIWGTSWICSYYKGENLPWWPYGPLVLTSVVVFVVSTCWIVGDFIDKGKF